MPDKFRLRPLHRQRLTRRKTVRVLNQDELSERLGVAAESLPERLAELDWPYHRDGSGRIWATERPDPPHGR